MRENKTKYPVEIDGDLINIDPKKMKIRVTYPFLYNGNQYSAWKDEEEVVTISEIFMHES